MSSTGDIDWSALDLADSSITLSNYTLLSSICLFYYDYILTIPTEVRMFWRSPLSLATAFYFLTRYGFFINITLVAVFNVRFTQDFGTPDTVRSCDVYYNFAVWMNLVNFATVSAFVATRLFAILGRNWPVGIFLFALGLANPNVLPILFIMRLRMLLAPWPIWGCEAYIPDDDEQTIALITQKLPIASSAVSMLYELVCLALTVWKTFGTYRLQRGCGVSATLTSRLLRDGSMYYLVMTALSIANIMAALIHGAPDNLPVDTVFGRVLTPILTTHFIAHLRQMDVDDEETSLPSLAVSPRRSGTLCFASVGAAMSYSDSEDE